MRSAVDSLIEAARLAPSGDNTQPWDFLVDRTEHRITVRSNPARDPSPMNAGDRMSRIAMGAALENMLQTAIANHWQHTLTISASDATIKLSDDYSIGEIDDALRERVTNRRRYALKGLPDDLIARLRSAVRPEGTATANWITEPHDRESLCGLIGEADSMMLSNETVRNAFLAKVRFDMPVKAVVEEGLSLGSLEVSAFERFALRMMRWTPDLVLKLTGIRHTLRSAALRLARSADGFCLITSSDDSIESDFDVGRVFQRSWLELTRAGLAVQPMMSLVVLRNIRDNGDAKLFETIGSQRTNELLNSLRELQPADQEVFPSGILRFGYADPPTIRTGRLNNNLIRTG